MTKFAITGLILLMTVLSGCSCTAAVGDKAAPVAINATDALCPDGTVPVDCGDEAMMSTLAEGEEEDCGCGD